MQKVDIVFDIDLKSNPIQSMRELPNVPEMKDKLVMLYQVRYNKDPIFICGLNGNYLGKAFSHHLSRFNIKEIPTREDPVPTPGQPTKYGLVYMSTFSLGRGVWELFTGNVDDPMNQKQLLFDSEFKLNEYYNRIPDTFRDRDAYTLHHHFNNGHQCITKTNYKILHGMEINDNTFNI